MRVVEFTKKQCSILMNSLWEFALAALCRKEEWVLKFRQLPWNRIGAGRNIEKGHREKAPWQWAHGLLLDNASASALSSPNAVRFERQQEYQWWSTTWPGQGVMLEINRMPMIEVLVIGWRGDRHWKPWVKREQSSILSLSPGCEEDLTLWWSRESLKAGLGFL